MWTALTDPSAVKAAIEARAKERREEERRRDELLEQALKLSSSAPAAVTAAKGGSAANKKLLLEISSMKNSPQPSRSRFSLLSRKSKGRD